MMETKALAADQYSSHQENEELALRRTYFNDTRPTSIADIPADD